MAVSATDADADTETAAANPDAPPAPAPASAAAAAAAMDLTLIVAATRTMGIGRAGTLPWTGLKREMAYFARVTKRAPTPPPGAVNAVNAVVMGRRTWDSIPPRFRPLRGRLNVVLSRSFAAAAAAAGEEDGEQQSSSVIHARSLPEALEYLARRQAHAQSPLARVFVIGGAQIYDVALALRDPAVGTVRRVLLTSILTDFECDTWLPSLRLGEDGAEADEGFGPWRRASKEQLDAWTGETVPEGVQEENGTSYEFQMWEREVEGTA